MHILHIFVFLNTSQLAVYSRHTVTHVTKRNMQLISRNEAKKLIKLLQRENTILSLTNVKL